MTVATSLLNAAPNPPIPKDVAKLSWIAFSIDIPGRLISYYNKEKNENKTQCQMLVSWAKALTWYY